MCSRFRLDLSHEGVDVTANVMKHFAGTLDDSSSMRRSTNKRLAGDRRVQAACDAQRTALSTCLLDDQCLTCYLSKSEQIIEDGKLCRVTESHLCAISCPSCGCQAEAEIYYQCLIEDTEGCSETVVDCADTECEAELNAGEACFATQATPCNDCAGEAAKAFYDNNEDYTCQEAGDAVCPAIYETCGCDQCAGIVESWLACFCTDFKCSAPVPPPQSEQPFLSPPVSGPMATPVENGNTTNPLAALSALVVIPFIAVIVYLVMRKKSQDGPVSKKAPSDSAEVGEFSETPPTTPMSQRQYAHTPGSHHHQRDPSVTASMRSDEDFIYGRHDEDRARGSIGAVTAGSGRSQNLLRASAGQNPMPYASPASSVRSTGGHALVNKDCCQSLACETEIPVAIFLDDAAPPQKKPSFEKRGADP